jgi:hypothetical protein
MGQNETGVDSTQVTVHVGSYDEVVDLGCSTVCVVEASGYSTPDGPSG